MSTHRPFRPHHPTPSAAPLAALLIVVTKPAALSAALILANFSWTSAYRPDRRPHHGARPDTGSDTAGSGGPHVCDSGGVDNAGANDVDDLDEETATAQRFVTVALDGGFGEAHHQAARTAVAVATEHGFVDDPKRVAEALVVFLHPDDR